MNCRKRGMSPKAMDTMMKEKSMPAHSLHKFSDKHGMERHKMPMPPKSKSGKVVEWGE